MFTGVVDWSVVSCILAEHSQTKSSRARFKKLVQLGKKDVCVCVPWHALCAVVTVITTQSPVPTQLDFATVCMHASGLFYCVRYNVFIWLVSLHCCRVWCLLQLYIHRTHKLCLVTVAFTALVSFASKKLPYAACAENATKVYCSSVVCAKFIMYKTLYSFFLQYPIDSWQIACSELAKCRFLKLHLLLWSFLICHF